MLIKCQLSERGNQLKSINSESCRSLQDHANDGNWDAHLLPGTLSAGTPGIESLEACEYAEITPKLKLYAVSPGKEVRVPTANFVSYRVFNISIEAQNLTRSTISAHIAIGAGLGNCN